MSDKRGNFSGKLGFVLASASSAVGLGNLWRFPYLAAEYGGGTFLFIYIILAVSFGFALMITEVAIGRKTGKSAIVAFSALATVILAAFVIKPESIIEEAEERGNYFHAKKYYSFLIKWICPIGIVAILISSILSGLGVFSF